MTCALFLKLPSAGTRAFGLQRERTEIETSHSEQFGLNMNRARIGGIDGRCHVLCPCSHGCLKHRTSGGKEPPESLASPRAPIFPSSEVPLPCFVVWPPCLCGCAGVQGKPPPGKVYKHAWKVGLKVSNSLPGDVWVIPQ